MNDFIIEIDQQKRRLVPIENSNWYKDIMDNLYRKNWVKSDDSDEILIHLEKFDPKINSWVVVKRNI